MYLDEVLNPDCLKQFADFYPLLDQSRPILTIPLYRFEKENKVYHGEMELIRLETPGVILLLLKDRSPLVAAEQEREWKFKTLVENGMDAVVILNEMGSATYISPNIEQILGYSEEESLGLNLFELLHEEDKPKVQAVWMEMLEKPGVSMRGQEARVLHKNGQWRWIEANIKNMFNDPVIRGVVDNFRDITDRKKTEEEKDFERRDKEALINSSTDLIWSVRNDLTLLAANSRFLEVSKNYLGLEFKIGEDMLPPSFFDETAIQYWTKLYEKALGGEVVDEEMQISLPYSNQQRWLNIRMNPIIKDSAIIGVACYAAETTRKKIYQEELLRINQMLAEAQKIARLGYWEVDLNKNEVFWSEETYSIWGLSPEIKPDLDYFYSTIHPDDLSEFKTLNQQSIQEGITLDAIHRILLPDGTIKHIHERGGLVKDNTGQPWKFKGTSQDISDEVKRTEEFRISNERLELVNKATSDAIWDWDLKQDSLYWGSGFSSIFGYELGDNSVDPARWELLVHPDDRSAVVKHLNESLADPDVYTWMSEYRFMKNNNEYAFVLDKGFMIRDGKGKAIRMIGALQDISSIKEAERILKEERNTMRAIIDNIPDYVFVKDREGRHLVCNKAQIDLYGMDSEEQMLNRTVDELLGQEKSSSFKEDDEWVFESGNPLFNKEEKLYLPDGGIRYGLTTKVPLKNDAGEVVGLVGISRDVTTLYKKQLEDRLAAAITAKVLVSEDIKQALQEVLALLGNFLHAAVGQAWMLNEGQLKLIRSATWDSEGNKQEWLDSTRDEVYLSQHYLAEYWRRSEPAYHLKELPEKAACSLIIPVPYQGKSITLLQYFYDSKQEADEDLLEFCAALGSKMGIDIKTKKSELELSLFFTHCPDPLCIASSNGFFRKVNPAFIDLFGFEESFVLSNPILSFIHPEDTASALTIMENAFSGLLVESYEVRFKTANGLWKWLTWSTSELFYEDGVVFCYGKDISELKEAERNLVRFKKVMDSSRDGFAIYNPITRESYMNQAMQQMLGYTELEVTQMETPAITHVDEQQAREMFDTVFGGGYYTGEIQIYTKDGRIADFYLSAGPINNEDGKVEAVYGVHMDISERKKYMASLLEANERYNLVARATNDAIWDWNLETNEVIRTGNGLENLFGYDSVEASADRNFWLKRVHPEDLQGVLDRREIFLNTATAFYWEDEYRFKKADGKLAIVLDKGYIIRNQQGKAIRMIGATQDITHRKQYLNEIIRVKQNLDALINNTGDMIWSYDSELKLIIGNAAFLQAYRELSQEYIEEGSPILAESLPDYIKDQWAPLYRKGLEGAGFTTDLVYYNEEIGEDQYLMVSFTPIRNEREEVVGAACFAKDISELKKANRKLEELNQELLHNAEELAASNADLERFAFIASHDLQEPLRMVSSFLQLLNQRYQDQLDQKAHTYIEFAVDGAKRMKELIHGLLDYARVGSTLAEAVPVDLNLVMRDVQILLKAKIEETNGVIVAERLPIIQHANYTQLLQLMQNLLGNALKYRGEADPVVEVGLEDSGDTWTIFVRDNGIGLDMRYADKIFLVFQRLHQQRVYSGTGIGLSICKRIVEKMGGKIWVESQQGKGSCFYFTIVK